jgi:hypothetical protein
MNVTCGGAEVINGDVDLLILATSPHLRPMHLKAATEAGKHVFMEKPAAVEGLIGGSKPYKYEGPTPNPYEQEHADLIKSTRDGRPLNEGKQVAESTMTAILGRMSAYTGRAIKWDWAMKASKLDLAPPSYRLGDLPVAPVPVPGKTPLIRAVRSSAFRRPKTAYTRNSKHTRRAARPAEDNPCAPTA